MLFLLSYHSMLIMTNQTTVESMGSGNTAVCPCVPEGTGHKPRKVNVFDQGVIANVAWFFEYSLFTWWLPFANNYDNDGTPLSSLSQVLTSP